MTTRATRMIAQRAAILAPALVAGVLSMGVDGASAPVSGPASASASASASAAVAAAAAPVATVDLATEAGVALVKGAWRFSDTEIVPVAFRGPGPDGQPTGAPVMTYDYRPKAGGADFDDSTWPTIAPASLMERRGRGRLSFVWYRLAITIPERIGGYDPTGATVVFQTSIDDYAEIWVDGELPRGIGQMGGSIVSGWNAPNRLVVARNVQPGQRIQLAVFGSNGPLSNPPTNFVWMREARLDFMPGPTGPEAVTPQEVNVEVRREGSGDGHASSASTRRCSSWPRGSPSPKAPSTCRPARRCSSATRTATRSTNTTDAGALSVFRTPCGYDGADIADYRQPGSNGLALDPQGRLTIDQHGNRRVVRLEADGRETVRRRSLRRPPLQLAQRPRLSIGRRARPSLIRPSACRSSPPIPARSCPSAASTCARRRRPAAARHHGLCRGRTASRSRRTKASSTSATGTITKRW